MMRKFDPSQLLVLAFGAVMTGCSPQTAPVGSSPDELRIHPVGTEDMADLTVALPDGACLPGNTCDHPLSATPTITLDGTPMTIGTVLRVKTGDHTLAVGTTSTKVTLAVGARTFTLPVARVLCQNDPLPTLASTDFGRVPTLRNATCPTAVSLNGVPLYAPLPSAVYFNFEYYYSGYGYYYSYADGPYDLNTVDCATLRGFPWGYYYSSWFSGVQIDGVNYSIGGLDEQTACRTFQQHNCAALGLSASLCPDGNPFSSGTDVAVVPGAYGFTTETAGVDTRTLNEGDLTALNIELPVVGIIPATFTTNITFNDPRELPDAATTTITSNCERNYSVPQAASGTLSLHAFQFAECNYVLNVPGRSVPLSQTADNNVTVYRLDIDDVTVTREDNTTFVTPGTFELWFGGALIAGPYPTNAGIDVLPGTYQAIVRYSTAEGPKSNTYDLTF
jgi:hypothetical protein